MGLGDWRYRTRVPRTVQLAIDRLGAPPEWYLPSLEMPAQYPDSARSFLAEGARRLKVEAPHFLTPRDIAMLEEYDSAAEDSCKVV